MSDILAGAVGPEAKYDVSFVGGKLMLSISYIGAQMGAGMNVSVDAEQVINALEAAIPGTIDNAVLDLVKVALKAMA